MQPEAEDKSDKMNSLNSWPFEPNLQLINTIIQWTYKCKLASNQKQRLTRFKIPSSNVDPSLRLFNGNTIE